MEIKNILDTIFGGVWSLMTGVTVPGLGCKASTLAVGFLLVRLSLAAVRLVTGLGSNAEATVTNFRTRAESATNYKLAREKKNNKIGF